MEWRVPVRRNGAQVGTLHCAGDGLRTAFRLDCPQSSGQGVEKLWLEGAGRYLLGTPVPVGGRLTLQRMVTNRQLEHLRPITGGVLLLSGQPQEEIPAAVTDPELRVLLAAGGFSVAEQGEEITLSWPWQPGEVLPVPPLFTLMEWREGCLHLRLRRGKPWAAGMGTGA